MKCKRNTLFLAVVLILLTFGFMAPVFNTGEAAFAAQNNDANKIKRQGDQYTREGNFVKAAEAYARALSTNAAFSDIERLNMARVLAWGGNLDRSKVELKAILAKVPKNLGARILLARVLFWQNDMDGSLLETEKALKQSPKDREALQLKADIARTRGELKKAVSIYEGLLKGKDDFDARSGLIYAYLGLENLDAARRNFDRLTPTLPYQQKEVELLKSAIAEAAKPKMSEEDSLARKTMEAGDKLAGDGKHTAAAEEYLKALAFPKALTPEERLRMASALFWAGKRTEARLEINTLLKENPSFAPARIQLARVMLEAGDFEAAVKELDQILLVDPGNHDGLLLKADIARYRGEHDKAILIYQELLKIADNFDARSGMVSSYLGLKKLAEARQNFDLLVPALPYQRQEVDRLKGLITEAENPRVLTQEDIARQTMETGNKLSGEGKHADAAEEYLKALALPKAFTPEERLRMATALSWAGNISDARREISILLEENPSFASARIQLARMLLWSGELDAAIKEIDLALSVAPDNRDVLLVRANALRTRGNFRAAIPLYNDLLTKKDDYSAREGLTYAYLLSNDRVATDKNIPLLKPAFPYEEKSLNELKDLRDIRFNPSLSPGFTFYHDSDYNDVWRYFVNGTVWLGNWKTSADYTHTDAKDLRGSMLVDDVVLSTYSRMPFYSGIGGSVGLADSGRTITWSGRADVDIPYGSIGVRVGEDTLSATAGVIRNHIRALNAALSLALRPTDRIALFGSYNYRNYSDDNYSHDVFASASYLALRRPIAINIGYRAAYLDFQRQSGGGYFDPHDLMSNTLFVNFSLENGPIYAYIEPYGGYQSFNRDNEGYSSYFGGGTGMIGYRFSKHIALEASAAGGSGAVGVAGAWNYYQVGARLIITF